MIVDRLSYVNSENTEINLLDGTLRALKSSDIFSHSWEKKDTSSTTLNFFGMEDVEKTLQIATNTKSRQEANEELEKFYRAYEKDVVDSVEGRLYFGKYYLPCNIKGETYSSWDAYKKRQRVDLSVISKKGLWYKDVTKVFGLQEDQEEKTGKDYPHDFPYDYTGTDSQNRFKTDAISDFNFRLQIYGPTGADPTIIMGGHEYRVFESCRAGESIIIDSREKTIVRRYKDGTIKNIFDQRDKDNYIFQKVKCKDGITSVECESNLVFKLTAYVERSRPVWI